MFPRVIYKFRNWREDNHKNVLKENELFLSPPNLFSDPYDCRITKSYNLLQSQEDKDDFIEYLRQKDGEALRLDGRDVDYEMRRIRQLLNSPSDLEQYQNRMDEEYFNLQDRYYGIVSFCINWKNFVLWSYYGDSHKGYAVGFHEELLRNSGLFGRGGKVQYKKKKPMIHPKEEDFLKRAFIETHTKSVNWRHEREYRLTKLFYPQIPTDNDRKINFQDNFIKEVIIGCQASVEAINEIREITRRKNIDTYKLVKLKNKFGLVKKRFE